MIPQAPGPGTEALENLRRLLDGWAECVAQVLESMTGQRPAVEWRPVSGSFTEFGPGPESELLWWEQRFQIAAEPAVWVAAPRSTWEDAGRRTLQAAGLDAIEPADARSTWLELLNQCLSGLAQSVGSILGKEVCCESGAEKSAGPEVDCWASVTLSFGEAHLPDLFIGFGPKLVSLLGSPDAADREDDDALTGPAMASGDAERAVVSRNMDFLLEVELPVSISFGKVQIPMKDVLKLTTGSIVELNRGVNEQVEVLVNHCLIARGEVVVVDGNYGVRIQQIASKQDRMRSVR